MPPPKPKTVRLTPLNVFRVRRKEIVDEDPCMAAMSSVLACWASVGYSAAGCAALEDSLRLCMDTKRTKRKDTNTINYHLTRFKSRVEGQRKVKGSKD
ncbi:40S ribosomal protein mrp10 [Sporothrix eucalyptigena]|uniref:40S ribosomal protein mrp10 n=1 Tax=Sporothrix eucalyptigena TaxID=1812306 RepID=A0ABP0D3V2_9PEZI